MTQIKDLVKRNVRVTVLIGIIVALIIVAFILYSGFQSSAAEKDKIETQLRSAKAGLTAAQGQYDLAALQAEQASLTGSPSFPSSFPNVDLSAYVAAAADKYGVQIISLTPKGSAGKESIGNKQYIRYDTEVKVAGDYEDMNSFVRYLEGGPFLSLRIENASFTPTGGTFNIVILTQS